MICLIRHAKTIGNTEKRYIGKTDEGICETETLNRKYPRADIIITSGMRRTIETAKYIYPGMNYIEDESLRECDFGYFEGHNYEELKNNADYDKWLKSGGMMPFPGGESHDDFIKRCIDGFSEDIKKYRKKNIAFIVHGGTIMAVMEWIFSGEFYDYQVKNGSGFIITEQDGKWSSYTML